MAIPYATVYSLAVDAGAVRQRVLVAVCVAAMNVFVEGDQTPNHAARVAWAQNAIGNPEAMARKMIWGVLCDPVIQGIGAGATDANIQTSVDALVSQFLLA